MRDAKIEQPFADDVYVFRLGWGEVIELQEKTDCGPFFLLTRIDAGQWMIGDVSEIIRIGLVGGGTEPKTALRLVERYVKDRPPMENLELARAVLMAGLVGVSDEPVGEPGAPFAESR